MAKAREIARQLAAGPPLLFPAIKQLLRHTEMVPEHEAFELHDSLDVVQQVIRSDDLKEGTRAFTEKSASPAGPAAEPLPRSGRRSIPERCQFSNRPLASGAFASMLFARWKYYLLKIIPRLA